MVWQIETTVFLWILFSLLNQQQVTVRMNRHTCPNNVNCATKRFIPDHYVLGEKKIDGTAYSNGRIILNRVIIQSAGQL